jgi:outer membrane protein
MGNYICLQSMNMKTKALPIIVAFLLGSFSMQAQTYWSLEQCITHALENNLQVKISKLQTEISEQNLRTSSGNFLPNVNGFATNTWNIGQTIDPLTNTFASSSIRTNQFGVTASMDLFKAGQNVNAKKRDQFNLEASRHDLDKMRNDVSLFIASAYLNILFAEELLDMAINQKQLTQKQISRNRKLYEAGSIPKGDLLNVESQLAGEELNVVQAQNTLDLAYLNLVQLLQIDSITDFRVVKPELNVGPDAGINTTPGQIYDQALRVLPEVKSAENRMMGAERSLMFSKSFGLPSLRLNASVGTGYSGARPDLDNPVVEPDIPIGLTSGGDQVFVPSVSYPDIMPFGKQLGENLNQSIGLTLSIPIFNRMQVSTGNTIARINYEIADNNLELAKNTVNQSIQSAYADAKAALNQYRASQKALEALSESFKYVEQRFEVGMVNSVDYNTAKVNVTRAESDNLRAKYDYVFKTKILDFYQGKPITLN